MSEISKLNQSFIIKKIDTKKQSNIQIFDNNILNANCW